jgi:hypothetical protein
MHASTPGSCSLGKEEERSTERDKNA